MFQWLRELGKYRCVRIAAAKDDVYVIDSNREVWRLNRRGWIVKMPSEASAIAAAADGSVWKIGSKRRPGGFAPAKWLADKKRWQDLPAPHAGVEIALGPTGRALVLNDAAKVSVQTADRWERADVSLRQASVGADGSAWGIGADPDAGGYGIWKRVGEKWVKDKGGALRVSVSPEGAPWVVTDKNQLYVGSQTGWKQIAGTAIDVAAGGNAVWCIGTDGELYLRINQAWRRWR